MQAPPRRGPAERGSDRVEQLPWLPSPAPGEGERTYRPATVRTWIVVLLLGAYGVTTAIGFAASVAHHRLLARARVDPAAVATAQLAASDDRQALVLDIYFVLWLATAVVFLVWLWRVYSNLEPLGARGLRFSRGWTVGGWFVPVLNLVRPKQLVDDAWRASDPDLANANTTWRESRVPASFHAWWALWLLGWVIEFRLLVGFNDGDPRGELLYARLHGASLAVTVVTALLAIRVVLAVTQRQMQRRQRLEGRHTPPGRAVAIAGGALAVVVVMTGIASTVVAATADVGTSRAERDATGAVSTPGLLPLEDLRIGDCFDDPTPTSGAAWHEIVSVPAVPCDQPHDFEVFSEHRLPDDFGPGHEQALFDRGVEVCTGALERRIGPDWMEHGYDGFFFGPSATEWPDSDRLLTCVASRLDGDRSWRLPAN